MPVANVHSLAANSPLLNKLYAAASTAVCGMRGEINFLQPLASQFNPMQTGSGHNYEGAFPGTPVGICATPADKVWFHHDLQDRINIVTGSGLDTESSKIDVNRVSMAISANYVGVDSGFQTIDLNEQTKLSVGAEINRMFRFGRMVAAIQGELMAAALFGCRGFDSSIYSANKDMVDAQGTSLANAATGDFMELVNNLQKTRGGGTDADAGLVRPISRAVAIGNEAALAIDNNTNPSLDAMSAYSSTQRLSWANLFRARTPIAQLGNEARGPFTFRPARINGSMVDAETRKRVNDGYPMWLIPHINMQYLQEDTSWMEYQNSLAAGGNNSTGLVTANAGVYKGVGAMAFDKVPIMKNSSGTKIAINVCVGQGALLIMYNTKRDPGDFGAVVNPNLRKFMETTLPVNVDMWETPGGRGRYKSFAPSMTMGVRRPCWKNKKGWFVDPGVMALYSQVQA